MRGMAGIAAMLLALPLLQGQSRMDFAFQKFWAADSQASAARAADDVLKSGITLDDALRRLKQGRTYAAQKEGVVQLSNRTADGVEHNYAVTIPANYDPARVTKSGFSSTEAWAGGRITSLAGMARSGRCLEMGLARVPAPSSFT
jgi:hypothetical protein